MARIKTGVPTVKELLEGESEKRYIPSVGLVNYTRYNNKLFTNNLKNCKAGIIPHAGKQYSGICRYNCFIYFNMGDLMSKNNF